MSTQAQEHDYLFLGTHGHVVALDPSDGREVWRTSLPRTGYSVASILVQDGRIFCASGGRAFALDPRNGEILWTNGLSGLGHGLIYLASHESSSPGQTALFEKHREDERASDSTVRHHG